jgi:ankyrin repeat protein
MQRIQLQHSEARQLAMKTLTLVLYAKRPLTVEELLEALAIEIWSPGHELDDIVHEEVMLECCKGLVKVQTTDRTVHFSHCSVQNYIQSHPDLLPSNLYLAKICLTYLLYDGIHSANSASVARLNYPFLLYASKNWAAHVKGDGESDPEILNHLEKLFKSHDTFQRVAKLHYSMIISKTSGDKRIPISTPLHMVAGAGLDSVAEKLLRKSSESTQLASSKNIYGWTPLHEASIGGHSETVAQLLRLVNGCGINIQDNEGMTALLRAAQGGHAEVLRILFQNGATVTGVDNYGRNALSIALTCYDKTSAKLIFDQMLLAGEVDVVNTTCSPIKLTLLHQIANLGYHEGVTLLLEKGANPYSEDAWGFAPIHLAARKGHVDIVKMLLEAMNNNVPRSYCDQTPLHLAAKHGQHSTVKLLLSTNIADCNAQDLLGFTPLHYAALAGQHHIVETLISITEIAIPGEVYIPSPIQLASWGGHQDVLELLVDYYFASTPRPTNFEEPEYSMKALSDIQSATEQFRPRANSTKLANLPYQLNAICYLAEHYGLTHLKSGRLKLASAWYDIALLFHPKNVGVLDPLETVNLTKVCDHCNSAPITGPCYTCTKCTSPCYDLCSSCFKQHPEIHEHEQYITIPASSYPLPSLEVHLTMLKHAMKEEQTSKSRESFSLSEGIVNDQVCCPTREAKVIDQVCRSYRIGTAYDGE